MVRKALTSLYALFLLTLFSCGAAKQIKEMHDATVSVDTSSAKLLVASQSLDRNSGVIAAGVTDTYSDLRIDNAEITRVKALSRMEKVSSLEAKEAQAAVYYEGFEYQLWKGTRDDNEVKKQKMLQDGMDELFHSIGEYVRKSKWSIDVTKQSNAMKNLIALSLAIHKVNGNSIQPEMSILKLIDDTLKMRKQIREDLARSPDPDSRAKVWNALPEYQRTILTNEKLAVYLLELRGNILPMLVFDRLTGISWKNKAEQAYYAKVKKTIEADRLSTLSYADLDEATRWMHEANRVHDFLLEIGAKPLITPQVLSFYKKLKIPADANAGDRALEGSGFQKLNEELKSFLKANDLPTT